MAVEGIADLDIFIQHRLAFVAAEPLELGWMSAEVHAGRHGAALEAVAAELCQRKAGGRGTLLDDPYVGPLVDFIDAKAG